MDTGIVRVENLGERSLILTDFIESPLQIAQTLLARFAGLEDAVPCYESVGLYFAGNVPTLEQLQECISKPFLLPPARCHTVPVCYQMGTDLKLAAATLGLTTDTLIQHHISHVYECAAVGFVPGFAYLGELPPEISGLTRFVTPRTRVEEGSVAIVGNQTAVYPLSTPGGWWIIGRTPLVLVNEQDQYFPIAAGDRVSFKSIGPEEFEEMKGARL